MLLKSSFDKTNNFFNKGLQNIKSFIFGGYKTLPRTTSFRPFSCSSRRVLKDDQFDHFEFLDEPEPIQENAAKEVMDKNVISVKDGELEGGEIQEKKIVNCNLTCLKSESIGGSYRLAQKMKEMEMMDVENVDHVLDIEEVLHYYSRLKSPVYLDIVDKFFIDMNSEIHHPRQPSFRKNYSKQKLKPVKLYKS